MRELRAPAPSRAAQFGAGGVADAAAAQHGGTQWPQGPQPQIHTKETEAHRCSLVVSTAASKHLSSERLKVHRASWLRQAKPTGRKEGKGLSAWAALLMPLPLKLARQHN